MLPYIAAHDDIWDRLLFQSPSRVQERYAEDMHAYLEGVVEQICAGETRCQHQNAEEYLDYRRRSVGVRPMFALIEYCHDLDLPSGSLHA